MATHIVGNPISAADRPYHHQHAGTTRCSRESSTALLAGYSIAGKTGTAQIPTSTGYDPDNINASFIGWGPVDDPRFLVYVWLEKPQSNKAASVVAAPIFKQVIEKLVVLMGIPPDVAVAQNTGQ